MEFEFTFNVWNLNFHEDSCNLQPMITLYLVFFSTTIVTENVHRSNLLSNTLFAMEKTHFCNEYLFTSILFVLFCQQKFLWYLLTIVSVKSVYSVK